jgi:protein SCO1/2
MLVNPRFLRHAIFLLAALSITACSPSAPTFKGTDISGVDWGGDFELTAHTGRRMKISDLHGKVVILFFGYTHCPDICAPTLVRLAQLNKQMGEDGRRVQVVFVTVDPKHDTVAQLAGFVPKFDPAFIGLTGSDREIAAVARDYKVAFASNPQSPAFVDHSSSLMVKDVTGKLRLLFKNDMAVEDMAHDVRQLLREHRR